MSWEIAITLAAIGLLGLFHAVRAPAPGNGPGGRRLSTAARGLTSRGDPWARILVAAALAATVFALGVLIVPALFDKGSESAPSTTSTIPSTSSTVPSTTHSTTTTTSTTSTTTTTTPQPPPRGSTVFVRASVIGSTGRVATAFNRLGGGLVVRRVAKGEYHIKIPALTDEARLHTVVRVKAAPNTTAVGSWTPDATLVVLTWDKTTGKSASRNFLLVVWGARRDLVKLPKTT